MTEKLFLLPHEWKQYYGYSKLKPLSHITKIKESRRYTVQKVDLHFPTEKESKGENFSLTFYESRKQGRFPTILVSPIFRGTRIARIFGHYFAKKGFNAVVVHHDTLCYNLENGFDQITSSRRQEIALSCAWCAKKPSSRKNRPKT